MTVLLVVLGSLSPVLLPKWLEGYRLGIKHGSTDNQATRLPADFLIGPDLRLEAVLYGKNAVEHLPIATLERWGLEVLSRPERPVQTV